MADITAAPRRLRLPGFRVCLAITIGELNSEQGKFMYNCNCPVACIATAKADLPSKGSLAAAFEGQWLRHTDEALPASYSAVLLQWSLGA